MAELNPDTELDRQYRLGYQQAWREWSGCMTPLLFSEYQKISNADVAGMQRRYAVVARRGSGTDG